VAVAVGDGHGLGSAVNAELVADVVDVRGHRLRADDELRRDVLLRAASGEQREDLVLAGGQAGPADDALRPGRGAPGAVPQQAADAREELVGGERLGEVVVRADQEPGRAVQRLRPRRRHEDDADPVVRLLQPAADLVAREPRELDGDHGDVGRLRTGEGKRILAARRADRFVPRVLGKRNKGCRKPRILVDNENPTTACRHTRPPESVAHCDRGYKRPAGASRAIALGERAESKQGRRRLGRLRSGSYRWPPKTSGRRNA
jgi:hypothetical protein